MSAAGDLGKRIADQVCRAIADGRIKPWEYSAVMLGALTVVHCQVTGRPAPARLPADQRAIADRLTTELFASTRREEGASDG